MARRWHHYDGALAPPPSLSPPPSPTPTPPLSPTPLALAAARQRDTSLEAARTAVDAEAERAREAAKAEAARAVEAAQARADLHAAACVVALAELERSVADRLEARDTPQHWRRICALVQDAAASGGTWVEIGGKRAEQAALGPLRRDEAATLAGWLGVDTRVDTFQGVVDKVQAHVLASRLAALARRGGLALPKGLRFAL